MKQRCYTFRGSNEKPKSLASLQFSKEKSHDYKRENAQFYANDKKTKHKTAFNSPQCVKIK